MTEDREPVSVSLVNRETPIVLNLLKLASFVGLFAFVGRMLAESLFWQLILDIDLPRWETNLRFAVVDAIGILVGGCVGLVLCRLHSASETKKPADKSSAGR